jgi:hypothetical protein
MKSVRLQRGDVAAQIFLGHHVVVSRQERLMWI